MSNYDWSMIVQRSGQDIESFVAKLLVLEYPDAYQVNPSQGDGGVDVARPTGEGLEVWQVKGFTTALTHGQFRQIKDSWERFVATYVASGERIARYHLVTPWTATSERRAEFVELIKDAPFPCTWDGEAYIGGLTDKYPATLQRELYGEGALDQLLYQKAAIAGSLIGQVDTMTYIDAVVARQQALDDLRDLASDNYRIEYGTRTLTTNDGPPLPDENDAAVFHRMVYQGDNRWSYISLVPRAEGALEREPISVTVEFLVEEGSPERDAVVAWAEWGIPFQDVRARVQTVGGPLADDEPREVTVSLYGGNLDAPPPLYLRCQTADGTRRFRLPLIVVERTVGASTGWLRLVLDTAERTLRLEMRFKDGLAGETALAMGDLDGCNPEAVLDELETLASIHDDDLLTIENQHGNPFVRAQGHGFPTALEQLHLPIARHLTQLQAYTSETWVMPSIPEITDDQFNRLSLLASIYGGTPHHWTWTGVTMRVPEGDEAGADRVRAFATQAQQVGGHLAQVTAPTFDLGNRTYRIDHPIVSTAHTTQLAPGVDPDALQPGDTFEVTPGADPEVTTAKLVDWTPGSLEWD